MMPGWASGIPHQRAWSPRGARRQPRVRIGTQVGGGARAAEEGRAVEAMQESGDRTGPSDTGSSRTPGATWAPPAPPVDGPDGGVVLPVTPGPVDRELFELGAEVLRDGPEGAS